MNVMHITVSSLQSVGSSTNHCSHSWVNRGPDKRARFRQRLHMAVRNGAVALKSLPGKDHFDEEHSREDGQASIYGRDRSHQTDCVIIGSGIGGELR